MAFVHFYNFFNKKDCRKENGNPDKSEKFFLFKIYDFTYNNYGSDGNDGYIAKPPAKLGHICEIHTVPPGQKSQRQKHGCHDRKNPHNFILPCVDLSLIKLAQLKHGFP